MNCEPPKDIYEVDSRLQFNEALTAEDCRYVHTEKGRGEFSFDPLLKKLGVNPRTMSLHVTQERKYILFCGHRGCGKSTELTRIAAKLNSPDLFFVVSLDIGNELDSNNLQYADLLMAVAKKLIERIEESSLAIDRVFYGNMETWFSEHVERHEKTKDFAAEVKAGIQGKAGIPFLSELFGSITNSFKFNSTYKDELRKVIKNSFSQFASAFNLFITAAEEQVVKKGLGRKILFVVDGTDRLSGEERTRFFIDDSHQLKQIEANFIYCAPISLLYEGNQVQQLFDHCTLPMIKITEKDDKEKRCEEGYRVLREMVEKRADKSLFDSDETINRMIEFSGGSPRELLKIMHYAFLRSEADLFDRAAVEKAIQDLATDYKRFLEAEHYQILHEIDTPGAPEINNDKVRFLLYNLALLEYNSYWRRSHPVVRRLEGYKTLSQQA